MYSQSKMDTFKLMDYIISLKRDTDIEELKDREHPSHEHYKNDKKALKSIVEFKKPLSFGKLEHSKFFLSNLYEDIEKYEDTREKNRLLKKENKHLRKFYKYMRNLLERQKLLIESDLIEDELVIKEDSHLNEENYYIMFKKNIDLTALTEKYEQNKKDMDQKFEDLEQRYKNEYHKSFMCQEHIEEIDILRKELKKSKINEETYKKLYHEHKNKSDNFYNIIQKLQNEKNQDIDLNDKLKSNELHKKEMKKTIDKLKAEHEKELEKQKKEIQKEHSKEIQEKDKMLQQIFMENAKLRLS